MSAYNLFAQAAKAQASVQLAAPGVTDLSSGRIGAVAAAGLGLFGVIIGWLAVVRPASRVGIGSGPRGGIVALAAGLIGMAVGAVVVATSDSGIGTGNGRAGAYVALLVGLIATVLGGRAVARWRRAATHADRPSS